MENIRSNEEFRNKVIEELNLARQDPKKYSEKIRSYIKYFKGRILLLPNQIGLMTNEGEEAFKEASEFLICLSPITKFKYSPGLTAGDVISILLLVVGIVIILLGIAVLIRLNK